MAKNIHEEEYFDISDKILTLSDELSEEIIMTNIRDQLQSNLDAFSDKINYISLFKEKYATITPESSFYDKNYIQDVLESVTEIVKTEFEKKYRLGLGKDIDFYFPREYLRDMEALYEFFFIRHFNNLADYFFSELKRTRPQIIERYNKEFQKDEHAKDIFVLQMRKKFKDPNDVLVIHFIDNILEDIKNASQSAFMLFDTILNIDPYEHTNNKIKELMTNYGNGLNFSGDKLCYDLYMKPLDLQTIKNEIRNFVAMKYLETCEIEG